MSNSATPWTLCSPCQASESLQLVFGVEVREVDPRERIYIMVPTLGLTCDAMQSGGQGLPKAGLLILIMWNGDWAPEEVFWGALSKIGLCVGSVHCALGPVRCQVDGLQTQPGDDGTRSHFFFKFSFNLILFFGHTMWHAGPSSQTMNQTHAPELEVCEVPTTGQPGSLHP